MLHNSIVGQYVIILSRYLQSIRIGLERNTILTRQFHPGNFLLMSPSAFTVFLAVSVLTCSSPAAWGAAPCPRAVDEHDAAQCVGRMEPDFDKHADDPSFNKTLGRCACQAGLAGLALLALERAAALDPRDDETRNELDSLRHMLTGKSPQEAGSPRADIPHRLPDSLFLASVEAELGLDSNINTATDARTVSLPYFSGYVAALDKLYTAQPSNFTGLNGKLLFRHGMAQDMAFLASAEGGARYHEAQPGFAPYHMEGSVGLERTLGRDSFYVGFQTFNYFIGKHHLDNDWGVSGQWKRQFGDGSSARIFLNLIDMNRPYQAENDSLIAMGGAGIEPAGKFPALSFYAGREKNRQDNPALNRDFYGIRIHQNLPFVERARFFWEFAFQQSRYDGENLLFLSTREDQRYDLTVGMMYSPDRTWHVIPKAVFTRNRSDIPVAGFSRLQAMLVLRRNFAPD